VDGLPTWVRWIIVAVVGLSPILTFWTASVLRRYFRYRRRGGGYGARRARLARQEQRNGDDKEGRSDRR
jgi:hypothetical protein